MESVLEVAMKAYFLNIYNVLYSVTEGMAVTMSHMFRRPFTVQYPNKLEKPMEEQLSDRFRGILQVDLNYCIACRICERTCPIDCIAIKLKKDKETKERWITLFNVDIAKCMYCGLCSENCSTNAIYHTKVFNGVNQNIEKMVIRYVTEPVVPFKLAKGLTKTDIPVDLNGAIIKSKLAE